MALPLPIGKGLPATTTPVKPSAILATKPAALPTRPVAAPVRTLLSARGGVNTPVPQSIPAPVRHPANVRGAGGINTIARPAQQPQPAPAPPPRDREIYDPTLGPGKQTYQQTAAPTTATGTPGMGPGVPQTQFEGLDMTQYGPLEDLWRDQGARFFDQTNAQNWFNAMAPGLAGPGQGQTWFGENSGYYATPGFGEGVNQDVSNSLQGPSTTQGYWDENGQFVQTPGMGENFADTTLGKYADGTPDVTNMAGDAYQDFLKDRPDILDDAGLEGYYDFAKKRGGESLNRELAARGVYGSGRGLDKLGDMYGGLEAELANRKADYYLRSLAEQRGWEGLGVQAAQGADISSGRQSQNELDWTRGLGNLAMAGQQQGLSRWLAGVTGAQTADSTGLARALGRGQTAESADRLGLDRMDQFGDFAFRSGTEELDRINSAGVMAGQADNSNLNNLSAGFRAAGETQNAERQRGQDYFNNTFDTAGAMGDMFGGAYNDVIGNDQSSFDAWAQALLGYSTENLNRDDKRQAEAAAKKAADEAQVRMAAWSLGTAGAPYTYGASLALPVGYEIYNAFN